MNNFPSREQVARLRARYPEGARVELLRCDDPYTKIAPGTKGSVESVDDTGTVFVKFDSGSTLGMVYGVDEIRRLTVVPPEVVAQIFKIRTLPLVPNMFSVKELFEFAMEQDDNYYELCDYLFMHTHEYSRFILDGKAEW